MIEINQFGELRKIIERDYTTFSGKVLENISVKNILNKVGLLKLVDIGIKLARMRLTQ